MRVTTLNNKVKKHISYRDFIRNKKGYLVLKTINKEKIHFGRSN